MASAEQNTNIVFVNLLREERAIDETSVIDRSLRAVERWFSQQAIYNEANMSLSKYFFIKQALPDNSAMSAQVESFRDSLKPGECAVIANGNSFSILDHAYSMLGNDYSIVDDRQNASAESSRLNALGIEKILSESGCTSEMPVILYSSNTGNGKESLAAGLSMYHPTVVAPDGLIAAFFSAAKPSIFKGDEVTGGVDENAPRQWRVFSQGEEIASYNWDSKAIHSQQSQQLSR